MLTPHVERMVSRCDAAEPGCFGYDTNALALMLGTFGHGVYVDNLQRIAEAAANAAISGLPLEEATFRPVVQTKGGELWGEPVALTGDELQRVLTDGSSASVHVQNRLAHCAFVCGRNATSCALQLGQVAR